jgi:hypothetical protein
VTQGFGNPGRLAPGGETHRPQGSFDSPSFKERLGEIAEILATGLMRLRARKSTPLLPGESDYLVETLAQQSGAVAEFEGDAP